MGAKWLCFVTFAFRAGQASAYFKGFVSSISIPAAEFDGDNGEDAFVHHIARGKPLFLLHLMGLFWHFSN
jgi:hypothetical protein